MCEIRHFFGMYLAKYKQKLLIGVKIPLAFFYGDDDVHIEDIKAYLPSIDYSAIPYLYFLPKASLPTTDTNVVDKILDHIFRQGKHEWKVRWKGYNCESDTWEPASNFKGFIQQE